MGLAASALLSHVLQTLLFGVTAGYPAVYLAVTVTLVAVAAATAALPAWRAMAVDPAVALREE